MESHSNHSTTRPFNSLPKKILTVAKFGVTFVFGSVFLLICVFWCRSYFYSDSVFLRVLPNEYVQVHAGDGRMCIWFEHKPLSYQFKWNSHPIYEHTPPDAENRIPWFNLAFWPTFARLYAANCFLALVTGAIAVAPMIPRRFTMRSLLIMITVCGVVVATIRWIDSTF